MAENVINTDLDLPESATPRVQQVSDVSGKSCCSRPCVPVLVAAIILALVIVVCRIIMCCPPGWKKHARKCYFFFPVTAKDWNTSHEECIALGSDLVITDNKDELQRMMDFKEEVKPISDTCITETSSAISARAGMTDLQGPQMLPELPALAAPETHHIFVSYSSSNSDWARNLIQSLEGMIPKLKACYHERDFIPGKTIIENVVEVVQGSQKIVLVFSPDFVQSRWCLLEANLCIFQDCLERKPVIPIMLVPCLLPLHLTHLTYIDVSEIHFLDKVIKVICTPNDEMKNATLIAPHFFTMGNASWPCLQ
ncbi:hypothetical protein WISP_96260 [Willisornis vidua]|uniref:TIR domain-containing protein n=1 Tax=Willisornis vidua TaxID=1566151 RepID=A0ABQ9D013_9PASS|nr:hypothetical protein WISP_96260 [Willisornis vidua]